MAIDVKKAKEYSGYTTEPVLQVCSNCGHFTKELKLPAWMSERNKAGTPDQYTVEKHGVEKNLRCSAHGFAVKKMASCNTWTKKDGLQ